MTTLFSKEKFSTLSLQRRHKYAADLLREWYEGNSAISTYYTTLAKYLQLPPLNNSSPEELSHRYHHHLEVAGLSIKEHNLLPRLSLHDTPSITPFLPIDIYLDHLRSAHNVGSIIRTTEALRLGELFIPPTMSTLSSKKVQDTSMGSLPFVSYQVVSDLSSLKRPFIALETSKTSSSIYHYSFPTSFTLLLGNEEYGLSHHLLQEADILLHVPMHGYKNSLNVACCFALAAGEITRQLRI